MLWEAWTLSRTWKVRPSEMYGIAGEFAAWCFDRAVTTFGTAVETDIKESTSKAKDDAQAKRKAQLVLHKWLNMPVEKEEDGEVQRRTKFRDPAAKFKKE